MGEILQRMGNWAVPMQSRRRAARREVDIAPAGGHLVRDGGRRPASASPRVCRCLLAFWLLAGSASCLGGRGGSGDFAGKDAGNAAAGGAGSGSAGAGDSVFLRPLQRLTVEFRIHRYSAPQGAFTAEGPLWKLVTGPLPDAAAALRLADNGFRAAIGLESDRTPLGEYLAKIEGLQSALDYGQPDASKHVEVDLGACSKRLVVFYYGRDGGLRGLEFMDARVKLRMDFEMRSVNLSKVLLVLAPEIEEPPGPSKWRVAEGAATPVPEERGQVFDDLAFSAEVPDGGFLLLGPTRQVYERPLAARPFFIQESEKGVDAKPELRESIYIISPVVRSYTEPRSKETGNARGDAPTIP